MTKTLAEVPFEEKLKSYGEAMEACIIAEVHNTSPTTKDDEKVDAASYHVKEVALFKELVAAFTAEQRLRERAEFQIETWRSAIVPDCGHAFEGEAGWACFHCTRIFCDDCAKAHFDGQHGSACQEKMDALQAQLAAEQQAREEAEHYHERDIKYINEQANFRLERLQEQLKFTEYQRDEFLKIIVDDRALQSPPPIIIESGAELKSLQSDNERLKGSLAQAGHLIESYREAEVKWQAELAASREENLRLNGLIGEACVDLGKAREETSRWQLAYSKAANELEGSREECARRLMEKLK